MKNLVRVMMLITGALLASGVMWLTAQNSWKSIVDFPQYYAAARMYFDGRGADIYNQSEISAVEHYYYPQMSPEPVLFCYPPFSLPVIAPLALLPASVAHYIWTFSSFLAYLAALVLLAKTFQLNFNQAYWLAILIIFTGPFCQTMIMGQPTMFMLLGLSLSLFMLRKFQPPENQRSMPWTTDLLSSLCLLVFLPKPHLIAPFIIYLLGAKRYRLILIFAVLCLGFLLASLATPGTAAYQTYLEFSKYAAANPKLMKLSGCITIRSQLLRFFPSLHDPITAFSAAVFVLALVVIFYLGKKFASNRRWLDIGIMISMPVGFVTALYVQPYDLLLLLPSLIVFGQWPGLDRIKHILAPALVAFAVFCFPIYTSIYFTTLAFYPLFWLVLAFAAGTVWAAVRRPVPVEQPASGKA